MIEAPIPDNEAERLSVLRAYEILDTDAEQAFDDLTSVAATVCGAPIALVSLVDEHRQWFKSKVGLVACETPRSVAFCAHAIVTPEEPLVVPDAREDPRFHDNPLVSGEPGVRFYAGAPLVTPGGMSLGTLCVIDRQPRELTREQLDTLRALGRQVVSQLELRRTCAQLHVFSEELTHLNKELQEFTFVAAHDLQEPLRKLVSFSQLLERDLEGDLSPRAQEDLGFIVDAAGRMKKLVIDLLGLSRIGTSELAKEPLSLGECVEVALDALSLTIDERQAEIEVAELPVVDGDRTLLTQLFQNLICNAIKFVVDEPPRVRVSCEVEGDHAVIEVVDNGVGVDPAHASQIFAPFKRLHGREEFPGTGIGLSIVRKAVERHGGRVWVEPGEEKGSRFRFTLPIAATAVVQQAA